MNSFVDPSKGSTGVRVTLETPFQPFFPASTVTLSLGQQQKGDCLTHFFSILQKITAWLKHYSFIKDHSIECERLEAWM